MTRPEPLWLPVGARRTVRRPGRSTKLRPGLDRTPNWRRTIMSSILPKSTPSHTGDTP